MHEKGGPWSDHKINLIKKEKGNMIGKNKHPIPGYKVYWIKPNPIPTKRHKTILHT
jgi:hypothetical protein